MEPASKGTPSIYFHLPAFIATLNLVFGDRLNTPVIYFQAADVISSREQCEPFWKTRLGCIYPNCSEAGQTPSPFFHSEFST